MTEEWGSKTESAPLEDPAERISGQRKLNEYEKKIVDKLIQIKTKKGK